MLALAATFSTAWGLEVLVSAPREDQGWVRVEIRLASVLSSRVEESLARGMPATLHFHGEMWRRRGAWFDRLESSVDASLKIRYEVWSERYRVERPGLPPVSLSSLDSVRATLSRPISLPVGRVGVLEPGARYYVSVVATLRPLSVEDIEEGEGWLSGEVESRRGSGLGILTSLPRSVFDALRNVAGLGDQRARMVSRDFDLASLFEPPTRAP